MPQSPALPPKPMMTRPSVEGQRGPLELVGRVATTDGRVDDLVEEDGPGVQVEADEVVGGAAGHLLGGDDEDLAAGRCR